jgi:phosphatidylserine decarboxylase
MQGLTIFNRYTNQLESEPVCARKLMKFVYGNAFGRLTVAGLVKRKLVSILCGNYAKSQMSVRQIKTFIENFRIRADSFEKKIDDFTSFNDFFCRKLKSGSRPICPFPNSLAAPVDGRMLAYQSIDCIAPFFIKGEKLSVGELTRDNSLAEKFRDCSVLIARLCPADYHRFHFPFDCVPQKTYLINGSYASVHPFAMGGRVSVFLQNKRMSTVLQTALCGDILMIEIGATCVGSIRQTFAPFRSAMKGEEKGYFEFGGSTVILLFEKNKIEFSEDLLRNTRDGIETYVLMGDTIADCYGCR